MLDYRDKLGEKMVTVAVTPNGFADAVSEDGQYFMLPEERLMKFCDFVDCLEQQEDLTLGPDSPVLYMQQQNSNLTEEMNELIGDVPADIDWATEAFGVNPDAANFWMGDSRAITTSAYTNINL
jgi:jumonji domain-containing protein 7